MRYHGVFLVIICSLVPLYWFAPLFSQYSVTAVFSQYLGVLALILMAFSQLMATRVAGVETVFGALDRVYVLHKWLGIIALVAILLHDTVDAEIDNLGQETWLVDLAETLGEFSLYSFLVLAVISIATFVPYQLWRFSHKFMGALFTLSSFHYFYMLKPFNLSDPVGLYVLGFCSLGMLCYLYTLMPQSLIALRYSYKVSKIEVSGGATVLNLAPLDKGFKHRAGQFCFFSLQTQDKNLYEAHPFSISSDSIASREIRLSIKPLGDYTQRLGKYINPGDLVQLSQGYGHFYYVNNQSHQVWVASGIGITPFIAWLESRAKLGNIHSSPQIHFYYCYKGDAAHLDQVKALVDAQQGIVLHLIDSSERPRLQLSEITNDLENELQQNHYYFCGPKIMRQQLFDELNNLGVRRGRMHSEEFELRSGIGLRKCLAYLRPFMLRISQSIKLKRNR